MSEMPEDSFHRTLDAALAKGRLVSTRDTLAKVLHSLHIDGDCPQPDPKRVCARAVIVADGLIATGAVVDVTALTDDEALVDAIALASAHEAEPAFADFSSPLGQVIVRQQREATVAGLRALAAALTEPRP